MKSLNLYRSLSLGFLAVALLQTACTETVILFKPSPYLDPMPITEEDTSTGKDPLMKEQWNLAKVGLTEETLNSPKFQGNYNIKVAILSTGIDYNSDELRGQVGVNKDEITQKALGDRPGVNREDDDKNGLVDDVVGFDVVDGDGFAYDRHGAGTAVAGIIAAKRGNGKGIAGLMKNVTLYPIRYINDNGQTSMPQLVQALEVVVKVKPDVVFIQNVQFRIGGYGAEPDVIAAELGLLKNVLTQVRDLKIPVVIGAGDDLNMFGDSQLDKTLRAFDNLIIVASTTSRDTKALLSNFSLNNVLTAAPGEEVLTLKPGGKYEKVSGTAFAAAHVTAALALAKASVGDRMKYTDLTPILVSAAGSDQVDDLMEISRGGNRLNIAKFLNELKVH